MTTGGRGTGATEGVAFLAGSVATHNPLASYGVSIRGVGAVEFLCHMANIRYRPTEPSLVYVSIFHFAIFAVTVSLIVTEGCL